MTQATADDKFADYKPTTAFFFPGQGAQSVGMAKVLLWPPNKPHPTPAYSSRPTLLHDT